MVRQGRQAPEDVAVVAVKVVVAVVQAAQLAVSVVQAETVETGVLEF
jgi:hypothetical protein